MYKRQGQNLDAFLAPLHIAVKIVPPLVVARYKLAALHGDQQRIVEAVTAVSYTHLRPVSFRPVPAHRPATAPSIRCRCGTM